MNNNMIAITIFMGVVAMILVYIGYSKGENHHILGIKFALNTLLNIFPLLIFAFIIAGMAHVLLSHGTMAKWLGAESGIRGILIGTIAGGFTPGGPYVTFPIAAALLKSGAGIGAIVAFITAWAVWHVGNIPLEIGIIGWKFTIIRLACTFFFPPIAGLIAQVIFSRVNF